MWPVFQALLAVVCTTTRSRLSLQLEVYVFTQPRRIKPAISISLLG